MKVFNDLKTRGVVNILNAVNDGLKGIGEALGAVVPATTLQTCIVHLIRNSLDYASWKDRKLLAAALRPVYTAASAEGRRPGAERLRARGLGAALPDGLGGLAPRRGSRHSVLRLPARRAPRGLHHQRHRERAQPAAQDHHDPRALP